MINYRTQLPNFGEQSMAFIKRIGLFLIVNFLVVTTVSIIFNFVCQYFGIEFSQYGYYLAFYSVLGMGSAFVSLLMSKKMVKWKMKVQIIDPKNATGEEKMLLDMVHHHARQAKITKMPEFGIYNSPDLNAFATGATKNNALVALSSGLVQRMNKDEVEGVIGHEIAHIANGDMVTMTLITGMMNTMVLFVARILADMIASNMSGEGRRPNYLVFMGIYMALQMALSMLGSILVSYFSRRREFKADAGGAKYAGREKMIAALQALSKNYMPQAVPKDEEAIAALKISGISKSKFAKLFSTHPPLEDRIAALERNRNKSY